MTEWDTRRGVKKREQLVPVPAKWERKMGSQRQERWEMCPQPTPPVPHGRRGHCQPPMLCQSPVCNVSRVQKEAAIILLLSCSLPCMWLWGERERKSIALSFFCLGRGSNFYWPAGEQKEEHSAMAFMSREWKGRWSAEEVQKLPLPPLLGKSSRAHLHLITPKAFSPLCNVTNLKNLKFRFNHSFLPPRWKPVSCTLLPKLWLSSTVPKHQQCPTRFYYQPSYLRG